MTGHLWGTSLDMSPPRPGNTVPPDHSPLVMDLMGYERSGQGFATQNFSVRVTGRQTEATILVFFRWNGDLGSFSVADGQVWMTTKLKDEPMERLSW